MFKNRIIVTPESWSDIKAKLGTIGSIIFDRSTSEIMIYVGAEDHRIYQLSIDHMRDLHADHRLPEWMVQYLEENGVL